MSESVQGQFPASELRRSTTPQSTATCLAPPPQDPDGRVKRAPMGKKARTLTGTVVKWESQRRVGKIQADGGARPLGGLGPRVRICHPRIGKSGGGGRWTSS